MLVPLPSRAELWRRLPRLAFGLVLCGLGIAVMVLADLGLGPWDVLHQGVARLTPIGIGTVGIVVGMVVLLGFIPLREPLGIGTVLNVLLIGATVDITLWLVDAPEATWLRWVLLAAGPPLFALGSGFYIGAGLGAGPRDGLMTGLARRGLSVGTVRTGIEITVLVIGIILGGTAGLGTLYFALGIGPMVHLALPRLTVGRPLVPTDPAISAR